MPCQPKKRKRVAVNQPQQRPQREESAGNLEWISSEHSESTLNPMLNSVVLARFFELCDASDLVQLRLVCKLWYNESLPRWKKDIFIVVNPDEENIGKRRLNVDHICQLYETPLISQKPYINYRLNKWNFGPYMLPILEGEGHAYDAEEWASHPHLKMARFWRHCSSWIRHLELCNFQIGCGLSFRKLIFDMTPNLETFIVDRGHYLHQLAGTGTASNSNDGVVVNKNLKRVKFKSSFFSGMSFSWRELFLHFPSLEELEIDSQNLDVLMVDALEGLCKTENFKLNLKRFSTFCNNNNTILERLFTLKQVELEAFGYIIGLEEERTLIPMVVKRHSNTLKKMRLLQDSSVPISFLMRMHDCPPSLPPLHPLFPFGMEMPNLTSLELTSTLTNNLDFLLHTPNLKILQINGITKSEMEFGKGRMVTTASLRKLKGLVLPYLQELNLTLSIYYDSESQKYFMKTAHIKRLGKCMPNVRYLVVQVENEGFPVICQQWKDLRKISISCPKLDNDILTGRRAGYSKRMHFPNITDLKYLHSCTILRSGLLADSAIYEGFLKLAHLKEMHVKLSSKTSNKAYKALCEKFPSYSTPRAEPVTCTVKEVGFYTDQRDSPDPSDSEDDAGDGENLDFDDPVMQSFLWDMTKKDP